ncbi:MAG: hypothetical protein PHQ65_08960 [Bacteroidales bacterium]|nr:hypothetical protein [Bacteroidales bacterium]MDD3665380.1 hypothetical protein [Bacteroidales bacterium]
MMHSLEGYGHTPLRVLRWGAEGICYTPAMGCDYCRNYLSNLSEVRYKPSAGYLEYFGYDLTTPPQVC